MNSVNKNARIAGLLYLLLLPLGMFGLIYAQTQIIVLDDAAATAKNIMESETLFRLSIMSAFLVQVVNILVVLALYQLLKPVNKNMAALMVVFLLVAVPIAMLSELNHVALFVLLNGGDDLATFTTEQTEGLMSLFLNFHEIGINIAMIFWGLWLLPMGYLVFKSGFLPKFIGILLMIGCFGYLVDVGIFFLLPDVDVTVSQFTFFGEILLSVWLLIKGVNVEQWEKRAREVSQAETYRQDLALETVS